MTCSVEWRDYSQEIFVKLQKNVDCDIEAATRRVKNMDFIHVGLHTIIFDFTTCVIT